MAPAFSCICFWDPSVLNPEPTAVLPVPNHHPPPYPDSEGVGLCEEQVPALEVIVEVEESTGGGRQEAVRSHPRRTCLTPGGAAHL